jgi:hypothetical protein
MKSELIEKSKLIDRLIADDENNLNDEAGVEWILLILREGFKGYSNMTVAELKDEATERGLLY